MPYVYLQSTYLLHLWLLPPSRAFNLAVPARQEGLIEKGIIRPDRIHGIEELLASRLKSISKSSLQVIMLLVRQSLHGDIQ